MTPELDFYAYCWEAVNPKYLAIIARFIESKEDRIDWFIDPLKNKEKATEKPILPCDNRECKWWKDSYFNNCGSLDSSLLSSCERYIEESKK